MQLYRVLIDLFFHFMLHQPFKVHYCASFMRRVYFWPIYIVYCYVVPHLFSLCFYNILAPHEGM